MDLSFLQFLADNPYTVIISDQQNTLTNVTNKISESSPNIKYGLVVPTKESANLYKENVNAAYRDNVSFVGTYYEAFTLFINDELNHVDILIFPASSMNPENQAETHFFFHLWNYKARQGSAPRLILIYRDNQVGEKIKGDMVLNLPSQVKILTYYDEDFTQEYLKDELKSKIEKIGALYPYKILIVVPSNAYKNQLSSLLSSSSSSSSSNNKNSNTTDNKYEFYTEDIANALILSKDRPYSAVIDLCMRKVSYSSVGGGIRTIDEIVGDDFTSDVDAIVKSISMEQRELIPLYRFINKDTHRKLRLAILPYVNHYLFQFQKNGIPYEEKNPFFPMIKEEEYLTVVGPFGNAYLSSFPLSTDGKGEEDEISPEELIVLAMLDSLDLYILDYGKQEQDLKMFQEYFSEFKGEDALDFFVHVWNGYVSYYEKDGKESFSTWVTANKLNYTKMVEFYNTLYSLFFHFTGKGIQVISIGNEEKERIKNKIRNLLTDKSLAFVEKRNFASIYKNDLDEEYKVGNLLQIDASHPSIFPINQEGNTIYSFIV